MKSKGFTLIELLVVIAIIGMLSAVILASLNSARMKSRDAIRKAQMVQIRSALNLYYSNNGAYPSTSNVVYSSEPGDLNSNNGGNWIPGLVAAGVIGVLPRDPLGGPNDPCSAGAMRTYMYKSDGSHYKIYSRCALELSSSYPSSTSDQFYDPTRPTFGIALTDDITSTSGW